MVKHESERFTAGPPYAVKVDGGYHELALFAGAGGGILGGHLLGWRTVCAVECNPYAASVLMARQNDGCLPPFPIWDDVCTFDGRPWRGRVDVVSGGFPCQDISAAGKGAGITGARSGLWGQMARIIGEVGPRFVFVENSPLLVGRGLGVVLGDLAALGYDARWGVLGARDAGAPHKRDRIWIVATDRGCGAVADAGHMCGRDWTEPNEASPAALAGRGPDVGNPKRQGLERTDPVTRACSSTQRPREIAALAAPTLGREPRTTWWETEPDVGRVAHGVANRVDRLKALGNGQVPAVVHLAWRRLRCP